MVGVVLNLAVWFALHTLFAQVREIPFAGGTLDMPVFASVDLAALALAIAAIVAMFRFKVGVLPVLGGCSAAGPVYFLLT